ncbi:MAG: ROK family protein [Candidatus Omnitrophica bacterium]|nr:ROK family protein [Candidatus Omnitrophota bacterium]
MRLLRLVLSSVRVVFLAVFCALEMSAGPADQVFLSPETTLLTSQDNDRQLSLLFSQYRFVAISLGGSNLRVSINDGHNHVLSRALVKWDKIYGRDGVKTALPNEIIEKTAATIEELINKAGLDKKAVHRVVANLAGPVDEEEGIFGSDFKTPNLPFDRYPFVGQLQKELDKRKMVVKVTIVNDAKGALWGETYHPDGLLKDYADGGIVIIGTGVNVAVKKNGEVYLGPTGREILEGGHNLFQVKRNKKNRVHYVWTGDQAKGGHPIERGKVPPAIRRQGKKAAAAFLQKQAEFIQENPHYPVMAWDQGMRDFDEYLSGPGINQRLRQAGLKGYTVKNLTKKAKFGDRVAIDWIQEIGTEIGYALAAFMAAYSQEPFVEHLVLVSGVAENLAKGVIQKGDKEDILMKSIRSGVARELVSHFGISLERARVLSNGVMRSQLTYERELVSYQPTDADILRNNLTPNHTVAEFLTAQAL